MIRITATVLVNVIKIAIVFMKNMDAYFKKFPFLINPIYDKTLMISKYIARYIGLKNVALTLPTAPGYL